MSANDGGNTEIPETPVYGNNGTEWEAAMAELNAGVEDMKASFTEWKTGMINQYLLNEDVSIYDFSGMGEMVCKQFGGIPCCYPQSKWSRSTQMYHYYDMFWKHKDKNFEKVNCYVDMDLKDPTSGKSLCFEENYPYTVCEEQYRDMCLYDKNGIACCTKKLDLVHSWLDQGWVTEDPSPVKFWIEMVGRKPSYANDIGENQWTINSDQIYHLGSQKMKNIGLKTRWNFECPTHHPVPAVAIILGCFIPVMVILIAVIGIQWYRGRQPGSKRKKRSLRSLTEEESAIDEIPPSP